MLEDFTLQFNKISCGSYHSTFIGKPENDDRHGKQLNRLYVWGQNDEGQLSDKIPKGKKSFQKKLEKPEEIQLKFGQREYEAISVASGPSYNLIIGQINLEYEKDSQQQGNRKKSKQKQHFKQPLIMPEDHERYKLYPVTTKPIVDKIRKILKTILFKKGTLANLFQQIEGNADDNGGNAAIQDDQDAKMRGGNKREGGYRQFYQEDRAASAYKPGTRGENRNQDLDPAMVHIERQEFMDQLQNRELATMDDIQVVTEVIYENNNEITLQQLEDFALGFQQDAIKLFMYGKCDSKLFSFNKKLPIQNLDKQEANKNISNGKHFNHENNSSESSEDDQVILAKMSIITRPTVITFPRFCPKIVQVSCGVGHILALTNHGEMYSWGNGDYGALGFGTIQSIPQPTPLHIRQNHIVLNISKVECGSLHSMCLTKKRQIFTWGCGKQGRLGHGSEEDVLIPSEIVSLSNMRVSQVSGGESHCAAITQAGKVYLWGNGSYGRLGTGFEFQENSPFLVDDLSDKSIVRVSCGAFHTFVLSRDGSVYGFGQNKYGKLGLNVRKENTVFRSTHVKIIPYRIKMGGSDERLKIEEEPKVKFRQIIAGYNHSMAITNSGKVYTWGYSGFGLLGRVSKGVENIPVTIESGFTMDVKKYKVDLPSLEHTIAADQDGNIKDVVFIASHSTQITNVQCVSLGTMVLTDKGEIYYTGDNRYGQLPFEEEKNQEYIKGSEDTQIFKQILLPSKLVKDIACGGDHIFAVTAEDKVYGWGRNDSAQLGIGIQQDYMNEPTLVPAFRDTAVAKIVCGPNYSAAITSSNRLMVAGSMEFGKLGLGTNQRNGFAQDFTLVSKLRSVKAVSCGPTHMLAIVDRKTSSGCGVFAWGNNQMGQLGIDSTESSYSPKEITSLKKSERFDEVCAGLDFSLGLSRSSKKVYMWGNIKYQGQSTSTSNNMHKTPQAIKDFENQKIKHIFCSQTYAFAISENDEIKAWGEWFYERAKETFANELQNATDSDDNAANEEDKKEQEHASIESSDSDDDESSGESDGSGDYDTSSSNASDGGDKKVIEKKRKNKDNAKEFHGILSFPDSIQRQPDVKLNRLAFGTNHAAGISEDGLLYTWGHNQCQQLGVSLKKYGDDSVAEPHKQLILTKLYETAINTTLLIPNKQRQNEEASAGDQAVGNQNQKDVNEESDEDLNKSLEHIIGDGQEQDNHQITEGHKQKDDALPAKEGDAGKVKFDSATKSPDKKDIVDPHDIELESGSKEKDTPGMVAVARQAEVGDLPQVKPDKLWRIKGTDQPLEQKQQKLQDILMQEKKEPNKSDEDTLFTNDKKINDHLQTLLMTVSQLPIYDRQRKKLKVMIKNAFLQRISEKPLNVSPAIDFNNMKFSKYYERKKRREKKANLQTILNILHSHPCYFLNMYKSKKFESRQLLDYLKIIYPSRCLTNKPYGPDIKNEMIPLISREQERVNMLLISFIKNIIKQEISDATTLDKIDFLADDSLIGRLFYRILKSQEKNVDTICSILAHLMNKFIQKLTESNDYEAPKKDSNGRGGKDDGKNQADNANDEYSPQNTQMYISQLKELVDNIMENQVLTQQNTNFKLKKVWTRDEDDRNNNSSVTILSMRFSSEISILIEIIFTELHQKASQLNKANKRTKNKEKKNNDEIVAQKILGLIFYRMINKITADEQTLLLYLYPYLRETKKQILIDEAMSKKGTTYLELCKVVNFFLSNNDYGSDSQDGQQNKEQLVSSVQQIRGNKLSDILHHIQESNHMQPKLLPMKHFENVLFHSISPYDFQLLIKRDTIIDLFDRMQEAENKDEIALMKPVVNDQLFSQFGTDELGKENKDFMNSLKSYPDKFKLKIPTRQFVVSQNPKSIQKCKDCQAVLTDDFVKLEGQPIIDQYEPEDKESLVSVYCDILREARTLQPDKNVQYQLNDALRVARNLNQDEELCQKIIEFNSQIDREIALNMNRGRENMDQQAIRDEYESLKGVKITDIVNFEALFNKDDEQQKGQDAKQDQEFHLKALANVRIFEDTILQNAQNKINERISHKNVSTVLQRRLSKDLQMYLNRALIYIEKVEIVQLRIQLFNVQLGLGNNELRKLTKNSDQVQQMKSILNQQKNQKYSQILYRVLPDHQKFSLRAIVQKNAKELIKNKTITEIKIASLKPMINSCKLLVMEDEQNDVLIKLLLQQKSMSCLCFNSNSMENLLLQFHLSQADIVEVRKISRAYQMFKLHVNLAFDSGDVDAQKRVCAFATKISKLSGAADSNKNDKKKKGDKKGQKKKQAETREAALQLLQGFNRRTYKDCIEFDLSKLVNLINHMLRTRYAYIFNSEKSPKELIQEDMNRGVRTKQ